MLQHFKEPLIDYPSLLQVLIGYAKPRDKISALLASHELLRIKKGLYLICERVGDNPYSKEHIANLIYGPSCVSLEYALSFYGLIPERVTTLTSITPKKNKIFSTPLGVFTYRYIHGSKYFVQVMQQQISDNIYVLMATPEKALADILILNKNLNIKNKKALKIYLFEDLRVDEVQFKKLNKNLIQELSAVYRNDSVDWLLELLEEAL